MKHWLLVYDKVTRTLTRLQEFSDGQAALDERFRVERRLNPVRMEVVVLGAESIEALKRTHGRYFYSVSALAKRALAQLEGYASE